MATTAITHATPMMMPSAVRNERSLLREIALSPTMVMLPRRWIEFFMSCESLVLSAGSLVLSAGCWGASQHSALSTQHFPRGGAALRDALVLLNESVAHVHDPF